MTPRTLAALALLALLGIGGWAMSASAYTSCNTQCYGYGNSRSCNTYCY